MCMHQMEIRIWLEGLALHCVVAAHQIIEGKKSSEKIP